MADSEQPATIGAEGSHAHPQRDFLETLRHGQRRRRRRHRGTLRARPRKWYAGAGNACANADPRAEPGLSRRRAPRTTQPGHAQQPGRTISVRRARATAFGRIGSGPCPGFPALIPTTSRAASTRRSSCGKTTRSSPMPNSAPPVRRTRMKKASGCPRPGATPSTTRWKTTPSASTACATSYEAWSMAAHDALRPPHPVRVRHHAELGL